MKTKFIGFIFCLFSLSSFATVAHSFGQLVKKQDGNVSITFSKIEWMDLETAADKNKEKKKLIFIDIYTDWCGWCKKMDQSTFQDSAVAAYMNEHFYAVKMNAESKDPIAYKEVLYEYKQYGNKGYNELAVNLLNSKMSFPSFVILSKKEARLGVIVGFQKPTELLLKLKEYAE